MKMERVTERLTLRPLQPGDAEAIETLAGDFEVADTALNIPHPYPKGSAAGFIASREEHRVNGDGYAFAVTLTESGTFLGIVGLGVDRNHNRGELGYWIGKPYWRKGYCSEAAASVLQFAFEELGLNRVEAAAMTRNPASSKVMEKIGMKHEGILRQYLRKGGEYEDVVYYGLLRSEIEGSSKDA